MNTILPILQIILAVLLIVVVLLQQQGSGLGSAFGGGGAVHTTKRGADKVLYRATIVIAFLFFIVAVITLFV